MIEDNNIPEFVEPYIKVFIWLLQHSELTRLDAIILSELVYFPLGCWHSARVLGHICGCHGRTIQKRLKILLKKQWVATLYEKSTGRRYVWATLKDPPIGPLFDYNEQAKISYNKMKVRNLINNTAKQMSFW